MREVERVHTEAKETLDRPCWLSALVCQLSTPITVLHSCPKLIKPEDKKGLFTVGL